MFVFYEGSVDKLLDLYYLFRNMDLTVYGLNSERNIVKYSIVTSEAHLHDYLRNPGETLPSSSVKNLVHPSNQLMYTLDRGFNTKYAQEDRDIVLYPIKSCDLNALIVLDKLLEKDPYYHERRSRIKYIVVEECTSSFRDCFCGSTDSGPVVYENFDLAYAIVDNRVIFKPGSTRGLELIEKLELNRATPELVERYVNLVEKTRRATRVFDYVKLRDFLEREMSSVKLWIDYSSKCIGCGNCNTVCPTCFCNEVRDVIVDDEVHRYRFWISCLTHMYGLTAGFHYRPELYMRFRHFILHKFLFKLLRISKVGCTGCGRCIAWCPMSIDFREIYRSVAGV